MNKNDYIESTKNKLYKNAREIMLRQIDSYYEATKYVLPKHPYKIGDDVYLSKGTLLHGTYKNFDGLKKIVDSGLISSWFIDGRISKYPSSVGVWNLQNDCLLRNYINFYSGGTIMYCGVLDEVTNKESNKTMVIPYDKMADINEISKRYKCHMWLVEQTKEARFMPSLNQDVVQVGIIFNGNNEYTKRLLHGDILQEENVNDEDVESFVNDKYYAKFVIDRKNKDDFFTDRESAILFGIPANLIEGILVGKKYENDNEILKEIKDILPKVYICNLDGKVIVD